MTPRFLMLITTGDRPEMLAPCLASIREHLRDWRLVVVAQGLSKVQVAAIKFRVPGAVVLEHANPVGMHRARILGLIEVERLTHGDRYVVCCIDDDMVFLPETNLEPCVAKALEPGVGLVSAGWIKHEAHLERARASMVDKFLKQRIVYTGGGLVFARDVAQVFQRMPVANYFSDNTMWSLESYLSGRENYRYRGSLTIHRVCSKGGRKAWVSREARQVPPSEYLVLRKAEVGGANAWHIGADQDLTPEAHRVHKAARERLLA